jgi:hypothetical protein
MDTNAVSSLPKDRSCSLQLLIVSNSFRCVWLVREHKEATNLHLVLLLEKIIKWLRVYGQIRWRSIPSHARLYRYLLYKRFTIVFRERSSFRGSSQCLHTYPLQILLEILSQNCSRRSQIVCYSVAIESPIQSR